MYLIVSANKEDKLNFHRISAFSIIDAVLKSKNIISDGFVLVAVINCKYEEALS